MAVATMRCFPDSQGSSQDYGMHVDTPSQLFPNTPESMAVEGLSQLSQGSHGEPAYLYPSTPDSYGGGSQPERQRLEMTIGFEGGLQQSLQPRFISAMTIDCVAEDTPLHQACHVTDVGMVSASASSPESPAWITGLSAPGAPGAPPAQGSWSPHGLLKPATAMAAAFLPDRSYTHTAQALLRREKRASHATSHTADKREDRREKRSSHTATPLFSEKRPRPTSSAGPAVPVIEEVSEEDRQRRLQKRWNGVNAVRNSPDYKYLAGLWDQGNMVAPPASKHDPADEKVSKRTWEKGMEQWRHEVRDLALRWGFVPAHVPAHFSASIDG